MGAQTGLSGTTGGVIRDAGDNEHDDKRKDEDHIEGFHWLSSLDLVNTPLDPTMKEHRHCTEQCYQNARQDEEKEMGALRIIGALCIRYKPTEKTDVHRDDNTLP
ncbi:MAG: hypothetical protein ACREXK_14655 [Gammaproteobacteria bacterium]